MSKHSPFTQYPSKCLSQLSMQTDTHVSHNKNTIVQASNNKYLVDTTKREIQTNSIVKTFIRDKDIDMKGNKYEQYHRNNLIERYSDKCTVVDDLFDERTIYHNICIKMRYNINCIAAKRPWVPVANCVLTSICGVEISLVFSFSLFNEWTLHWKSVARNGKLILNIYFQTTNVNQTTGAIKICILLFSGKLFVQQLNAIMQGTKIYSTSSNVLTYRK